MQSQPLRKEFAQLKIGRNVKLREIIPITLHHPLLQLTEPLRMDIPGHGNGTEIRELHVHLCHGSPAALFVDAGQPQLVDPQLGTNRTAAAGIPGVLYPDQQAAHFTKVRIAHDRIDLPVDGLPIHQVRIVRTDISLGLQLHQIDQINVQLVVFRPDVLRVITPEGREFQRISDLIEVIDEIIANADDGIHFLLPQRCLPLQALRMNEHG